jgi:hypothetical protein
MVSKRVSEKKANVCVVTCDRPRNHGVSPVDESRGVDSPLILCTLVPIRNDDPTVSVQGVILLDDRRRRSKKCCISEFSTHIHYPLIIGVLLGSSWSLYFVSGFI